MDHIEGDYKLEAITSTGQTVKVDCDEVDIIANLEGMLVIRIPESSSFDDCQQILTSLQENLEGQKFLLFQGDIEFLRVTKVT